MIKIFLFILILEFSFAKQSFFYISEKNSPSHDLFKFNTQTKKALKITSRIGNSHYPHYNHPKLSPDGKKLLIQADPKGHDRYTIWTMNLDGTNIKEVSENEGLYPNWSADGKSVYYSGRRNGIWEILQANINKGNESNLTENYKLANPPGWGATLSADPDGKRIVYTYIREKVLYELNLKTKRIKALSTNKDSFTHPNFSHNGDKIAVFKKLENKFHLVLFDIKTAKTTSLSTNVYSYYGPSWSKDDSEILFTGDKNNNAEIYKVTLSNKKILQLTNDAGFNFMPIYISK